MKKIFKRTLAIMLAVIMTVGAVPLAGFLGLQLTERLDSSVKLGVTSSAEEATLEDYELDNYLAEISLDYGDSSYVTLMYSFFEVLPASMFMVEAGKKTFEPALEAWYATKIVANPGNALDNLNYKQQYEAIIYAILFDALCDSKMNSFSYENAITKVSSFTKKVVNSWNDAEIIDKTDLTATEKESLKEVALTFINNGESNLSAFGDYVELVNKASKTIDKFLKTATNVMTYIEKISMMSQLIDMGNAGISYLYLLKNNTNDTYLKDAIQSVIDSLSNDWVGMIEEVLMDAAYTFSKNGINKLIKKVWGKVCAINPFLAGMSIGDVAGTFACNVLFGTEDMIEKYSSMKKYVEIHQAALAAFSNVESLCGQNRTNYNVGLWLFAIDFLQSEIISNYQVSSEFAKATTLNGAVNKFTSLFSDKNQQTYDEFKEEVDWFLDFHKRAYYEFYKSRNYRLQDDYPELYEKIYGYVSAPQHISEIKFNDKMSANFIKGNVINLNFDVYPLEYIGEIAITCDSDIVSIEDNYKCWAQDAGEAEITVYSVDNPEICDTVQINIVNNAISFELGVHFMDGETELAFLTGSFGNDIAAMSPNPSKDGYKFKGWQYADGTTADFPITLGTEAVYVYPIWEAKSYYIEFYAPTESVWLSGGNQCCGDVIVAPEAPSKNGYTFVGWFDADGNPMPETVPAIDNQVYYGHYKAILYDAIFYVDGEEYHKFSGAYHSSITAPENPEKEGYTFNYWTKQGSTSKIIFPQRMPLNDVNYEAKFTVNKYTITYYVDNVAVNTETYKYGAEITTPDAPEKEGYEFIGWTPETPDTMPARNLEFTAVFEEIIPDTPEIPTEPTTEPTTAPVVETTTIPATTVPTTTTPVVTEPITVKPTEAPATTKPVTTEPATDEFTEAPTTTEPATAPVETAPSTTKPAEVPATESTTKSTENTKPVEVPSTTKPVEEPTTKPIVTEPSTKPVEVPTTTKPVETKPSTEPSTKPSEPITKPSEPTTKPVTPPVTEVKATVEIRKPSQTEITYGDSIVLHAEVENMPEGAKIVWTADNGNFTIVETSADGTACTVTPVSSGDTVFTATVVDAEGNTVATDTQTMTAKAGFFQKIIAFFKKLFGMTKVIPEAIKNIF